MVILGLHVGSFIAFKYKKNLKSEILKNEILKKQNSKKRNSKKKRNYTEQNNWKKT